MQNRACLVKICFLFAALFACSGIAMAQQHQRKLATIRDTVFLDSAVLYLSTLKVKCSATNLEFGKDFKLTGNGKSLIFLKKPACDSVLVLYDVFPEWLTQKQYHRQPMIITDPSMAEPPGNLKQANLGSSDGVVTDGVLLRGISFGNAQDLVLNSSLNLRMSGSVSKDISIEAAVTDQEFPFQPEGTTSTLQDFDRIYMQLKMKRITVLLGDHAFNSTPGLLFMKYAKKDRGLQLSGVDTLKRSVLHWEATAALARGRFCRNEINGVEGLQGPYRLQGTRGEQFIIIVSGTEAVYLDGKRMERGLQADYVVDYNTGEVTFTPRHLITVYSRIVVEFQYSDRAYTRSVTGGNLKFTGKKNEFLVAVYSEQDAPSQPIQQDLTAYDSTSGKTAREILAQSGDNVQNAVLSTAKASSVFNAFQPNYIKIDSGAFVFYRYVATPDTHHLFYTITFTWVGAGKGHYTLLGTVANGKAYRYAGEISGVPAGDYEPVTQLRAPGRISMAEGMYRRSFGKNTSIKANISASSNDQNLLSGLDDRNNNGVAAHMSVADLRRFGKDSVKKYVLKTNVELEQTSANFTSIERYRDVEFGRTWNRNLLNPENGLDPRGSAYATLVEELSRGEGLSLLVKGGIHQSAGNQSNTATGLLKLKKKGFFLEPGTEWMQGKIGSGNNSFFRWNADAGYRNQRHLIQLNQQQEQSTFQNQIQELQQSSYAFSQSGVQYESKFKLSQFSAKYTHRNNQDPVLGTLKQSAAIENAQAEYSIRNKKAGNFFISANFRKTQVLDTVFKSKYANENHFGGRLEYHFNKLWKVLGGNVFYQSISGREQQRQYSYFEVPAGQGYYTWVDFNKDSIKQINEFQETQFRDLARYVRLLVPTGTYIRSQGTDFSGNIILQPFGAKRESKAGITNRLNWTYTGKSTSTDWLQRISPFIRPQSDPSLLSLNAFWRDQLEFENGSGKLLVQLTSQSRGNKAFFTSGFDTRKSLNNSLFIRTNAGQRWQLRATAEQKNSRYNSEILPENAFHYKHFGLEPAVSLQRGSRLRLTFNAKYSKDKTVTGVAVADLSELGMQVTKSVGKSGILDAKFSSLKANYHLPTGTPLSYDILQGFSSGNNYRLTIDLRFNASKNIQMLVSYEGRKTGDSKIIHVGRAEARYLF